MQGVLGAGSAALLAFAMCPALAQKPGVLQPEGRPGVSLQSCESPGDCRDEPSSVTIDAQWRWLHDVQLNSCMEGEKWNATICKSPRACTDACALEGIDVKDYQNLYGVKAVERGIQIGFVTESEFGRTVGSRLYLMENDDEYKVFKLMNREIAFDVDVSTLPCGLNGGLYLAEMDARGGHSVAGAKFGTGYCDAQCPHGLKFVDGEANLQDWDPRAGGHFGSCCTEMDIFEANSMSASMTAHPCAAIGPRRCEGEDCGDDLAGEHYSGLCDKDGCDFNTYRVGARGFYGPGASGVDTNMPFRVVTQFLTSDGTDSGDLVEIRRFYVQGGKVVANANASGVDGVHGNSLTDAFCDASKKAFEVTRAKGQDKGPFNKFREVGGLKAMGEALGRGMVLVLALWDDPKSAMRWLDSAAEDLPDDTPGVLRGACTRAEGDAFEVEQTAGSSFVKFSNIRFGAIGATTPGVEQTPLSTTRQPEPDDDLEELPQPPDNAEEGTDAADNGHDWECHLYLDGQGDDWCDITGILDGVEYRFLKVDCGGCSCCKRLADSSESVSPEHPESPDSSEADGWECHMYLDRQSDEWCQTVGTADGAEYKFLEVQCGGCSCCKRTPDSQKASGPSPQLTGSAASTSDWRCHDYEEGQQDNWCRTVGTIDGVEYRFFAEDAPASCNGCLCCKKSTPGSPEADQQAGVVIHDCKHGDRFKWHSEKQEWCCTNWQIACPDELAAGAPPPVRLNDANVAVSVPQGLQPMQAVRVGVLSVASLVAASVAFAGVAVRVALRAFACTAAIRVPTVETDDVPLSWSRSAEDELDDCQRVTSLLSSFA